MYLVNQNLTTKVCEKVCGKVHVLTKLTKSPIQYLHKSPIQACVLDKEKLKLEYN